MKNPKGFAWEDPKLQFPSGSEHLVMPRTVFFSVFMGNILRSYLYAPLTLESMRRNHMIDFVLINLINNKTSEEEAELLEWRTKLGVENFHVHVLTLESFRDVVKDRLGIEIAITSAWSYKLCDFKPTLAFLFPQYTSEAVYSYWAFGDIDVVWGNVSRFAYLFQDPVKFPVVITAWW